MKEKNTLPSKGKSILYFMLSLTTTPFVSSFIYFLVSHPSLDNKAVDVYKRQGLSPLFVAQFGEFASIAG